MYSDLPALKERLPEPTIIDLTDDADSGVVDTAVVDRAIGDADTEIDSYLAGCYAVPVSPVPALLQRLSLDLAIEILYGRRPDIETPEAVVRAAKNARVLLANISGKKADLPGVSEANTSGTSAAGATFSSNDRLFSRTTLRGM